MKAYKIINHGMFHDTINYKELIESQANAKTFLDNPKEEVTKNYRKEEKTKKLTLYRKIERNTSKLI